jgi:hypothetical protein
MIESSRRHGHFDTRWNLDRERGLRAAAPAEIDGGRASLRRWEDDGGRHPYDGRATAELDWAAFLSRYFPRSLRHDLEALKAYEAYRCESDSTAHRVSSLGRVRLSERL